MKSENDQQSQQHKPNLSPYTTANPKHCMNCGKPGEEWITGEACVPTTRIEVEAMIDRRLLAAYLNMTSRGFRDHSGEALMLRNGRWGTCSGCPQRNNNVHPEYCQYTGRSDHSIHSIQNGKFYEYGKEIERSVLIKALTT